MTEVFDPDLIQDTPASTRTCEVCGYVGTVKDVHTQADNSEKGWRHICCTCLGHPKGSCWKKDRFPDNRE